MTYLGSAISAMIVAGCGYLFYRIGGAKPAPAAERYWKRLSLAAEICIAIGLIGLAAFAGRMKVSADHQVLEQRMHLSQAALGERLRLAIVENCEPGGLRPAAPYNPTVAKQELCAFSRSHVDVTSPALDWVAAEKSLREFPLKYPGCIDNVFTRHSDCEQTVGSAIRLADAIQATGQETRSARYGEAMEAPDGWGLLLLAFFIAAIGVSIKCARAAAEVFPARTIRR
ncbi:MAG: hypothetical protein JWP34_1945 [Massilia sp.]|nr:hypothetical protein [Massilia sp.]